MTEKNIYSVVSARITKDQHKQLKMYCLLNDVKLTDLMLSALNKHLEDLEADVVVGVDLE